HVQSMAPLRGRKVALVVGNETEGATPETLAGADLVVRIPMAGAVESLNVGVATGISIYELRMRMILTMLTDRIRNSLGRNLGVAAHLARLAFDAQPGEFGELVGAQVVLLMVVVCEHSTPVDQLRRDLGVTEGELAELVRPLRERGYLTGDDEVVTITRDGEQAVAALWTVQERVEDQLCAGFTTAERDQLHALLGRVQQNAIRLRASVAGTTEPG
ncbi:MAG: TrmH family RNA methyltransferase, partial [Acidimicrobiales bacterium]